MIGRITAIALNTFREAIRNKVLYGILAVVIGANMFALVLGEMSLHEETRVALDVGLAGVSWFGVFTAIVLGVSLLYGEVQKKTVHNILSKPILRHEFVVGKYFGMAVTLTFLCACFAIALAGLIAISQHMNPYKEISFNATVTKALFLAYLQVLVVAAIAIFFSSFSASPFLSGVFTFALYFVGTISTEVRVAVQNAKDAWIRRMGAALKLVPDLQVFTISGGEVNGTHVSVHGHFVSWEYVGTAGAYALAWIAVLLLLAALIFRRRDFV
ncbi:MAG: ABC transporter permease subunit [Deltaproteobacteria bacterium]|nr:ABC transporter permease subunit [Deltaproteobacteria bacterium]